MKANNITLCLFVSFAALAICTFFFDIPQRIIVAISVSSLLYTTSQVIKSRIDLKAEETKSQLDAFNTVGNFNLSPAMILFVKRYFASSNQSKKDVWIHRATVIIDCLSFGILILGCIIPMPFLENKIIGDFAALLSFGLLFLSMWQVEKYSSRRAQWEEAQLLILAANAQGENITEDNKSDICT